MPLMSPTLKIRCPICRKPFHPGDCAIYSTITSGKLLRKSPVPGSFDYIRSRTWIEELVGPEFTTEMARRQCPHCKAMLFEGIETCENLNIAIVGDISSGKTHFIALLIDLLKRGVLIQNGNGLVRLMHLNQYTVDTYRNQYYKPIIQDHTAVMATPGGRYDAAGNPVRSEPLVYQLVLQDHTVNTKNTINLLFYDISGEDLADNILLVQFGEHVLRADGIIYLADPLAMQNIRQYMPSHIQSSGITIRTAEDVLSTVIFRLQQYKRVRPEATIDIPTAIVVSKADLIQHIVPPKERPNYWLMYKPAYDGKAHQDDIWRVDQEVRFILHKYGEYPLLQISKQFDVVSFFAVSATGNAPDGNGKYAKIEPHRVLDPFIWLLWKLQFLQGTNR